MGAGKSHCGKQVALQLNLPFIDLDQAIELSTGLPIQAIFDRFGVDGFRSMENKTLQQLLSGSENFIMACGGGTPCFFDNLQQMKRAGKVIWLNPSESVLVERLKKNQESRPLLKNLDATQLLHYVKEQLNERLTFYQQADFEVNDDNLELIPVIQQIQHGKN